MLRAFLVLVCSMLANAVLPASDSLLVTRDGRWAITIGSNFFSFRVPDLSFESNAPFVSPGISIRWDRSNKTSWRITHARSFPFSDDHMVNDPGFAPKDHNVHREIWANDTRFDVLLRNLRTAREGRGLYFTGGLVLRTIWLRYNIQPDPGDDPTWGWYTEPVVPFYNGNDAKSWLELYGLWSAGLGFDRRLGPVDVFVEANGEAFFTVEVGGGAPISLRPRTCLGVTYRLGKPAPARK